MRGQRHCRETSAVRLRWARNDRAVPIVLAMRQFIMLELDLSTLRRAIGGGSYARGAEYARLRAVQHVTRDAEETALHGTVRGQGGNVYQTASRRAGSG
jgi:uncharacterized Zn finger protein